MKTKTIKKSSSSKARSAKKLLERKSLPAIAAACMVIVAGFIGYYLFTSSAAVNTQLAFTPPGYPNYTGYTTVNVSSNNRRVILEENKDYIVKFSSEPIQVQGGVNIFGGRNVVVIGGEIRHDTVYGGDPGRDQRGIYLQNWSGTMHVEGLYISGSQLGEGINVDTRFPNAILQLQNIRVDTVKGSQAGNHADVIQNWGGPNVMRIDRLTGSSNYQGFFLQSTQFGSVTKQYDFRNINLKGALGGGRYLLYDADSNDGQSFNLQNVWMNPGVSSGSSCGCYPHDKAAWSAVNAGSPSGGDFVPAGVAGLNYRSPGYAGSTTPPPAPDPEPEPEPEPEPTNLPDLVVDAINMTPANPKPGDEVTFSATVRNRGTAPTTVGVNHAVLFRVDGSIRTWSGSNPENLQVSIEPGATRTFSANKGPNNKTTWTASAGNFTLNAEFDDQNLTQESDETNNTLDRQITISTVANPEPEPEPQPTPAGDMNGDNKVDVFDLSYLLGKWNGADTKADLNNDGIVSVFDLSVLLSNWAK